MKRTSQFHFILLILMSVGPTCHAGELVGEIPLSASDVLMHGESIRLELGSSVAQIGDFNLDGYDDYIVGSQRASPLNRAGAGEAYLFYGGPDFSPAQRTRRPRDADVRFMGVTPGSNVGMVVSSAGDLNHDGLPDLLVGGWSANGVTRGNELYLVYGRSGADTLRGDFDLNNADASFFYASGGGDPLVYQTLAPTTLGDFDGDGLDDLAIGVSIEAAGATFVFYGKGNAPFTGRTNLADADASFYSLEYNDSSGWSVASAGDVDGDGLKDMIIGAPYGRNDNGGSYLIYGRPTESRFSGRTYLTNADATFIGAPWYGNAGWSVASAGDFNGDGLDDFLIGAPEFGDPGNEFAGQTYLILGRSDARYSGDIDVHSANLIFDAVRADDFAGTRVAPAGDVNGDGFDDLLIGAPAAGDSSFYGEGGHDSGAAYLIYGRRLTVTEQMTIDLANADATFFGTTTSAYTSRIAGGGDINGDSLSDIVIGAYNSSVRALNSGSVYVIYGRPVPEPTTALFGGLAAIIVAALRRGWPRLS